MKTTSLKRNTRKPRSALRLISTTERPYEEWLEVHKRGIGSNIPYSGSEPPEGSLPMEARFMTPQIPGRLVHLSERSRL